MIATPGPWHAVNRSADGADDPFLGWDVEGPPPAQRGMFQNRADAYLAAAAPDLLAALRGLRDFYINSYNLLPDDERLLVEVALTAIDRAEGRTS